MCIERREIIIVGEYAEWSGLGNEYEVDRVAEGGVQRRFDLVLSLSGDGPAVPVMWRNGITVKEAYQVRGFEDDLIQGETTCLTRRACRDDLCHEMLQVPMRGNESLLEFPRSLTKLFQECWRFREGHMFILYLQELPRYCAVERFLYRLASSL